jgi:hypothetical protein
MNEVYERNLNTNEECFIFFNSSPEFIIICEKNGILTKYNEFNSSPYVLRKFNYRIYTCLHFRRKLYIINDKNNLIMYDLVSEIEFFFFQTEIIAFSIIKNLNKLICLCSGSAICFFDLSTENFSKKFQTNQFNINSLIVDPLDKYIISVDSHNAVVYEINIIDSEIYLSAKKSIEINNNCNCKNIKWHQNGLILAIAFGHDIKFYERVTWFSKFIINTTIKSSLNTSILFSPLGDHILCNNLSEIYIFNLITKRKVYEYKDELILIQNLVWKENRILFSSKGSLLMIKELNKSINDQLTLSDLNNLI